MTGTVLLTGASGALGPVVVRAFDEAGYGTRVLCLGTPPENTLPQACRVLVGDICDRRLVEQAVDGADVVVHMAALLHVENPPAELEPEYERVNVEGTKVVVEAAAKAGTSRLVYFSTISVYGPGDGRLMDETAKTDPRTPYAASKLAAEQVVLGVFGRDGARAGVVLRLAATYGARTKGNYARLIRALARGRFLPIGAGRNRRTLVHEDDVAAAAVLAAGHPAAPGGVFNVTDGSVHPVTEINGAICSALGRRAPRFRIPASLARTAAGGLEIVCGALRMRPPVTRAMLQTYGEDVAVAGDLVQERLGFRPQWDLEAGWRKTIVDMRRSEAL